MTRVRAGFRVQGSGSEEEGGPGVSSLGSEERELISAKSAENARKSKERGQPEGGEIVKREWTRMNANKSCGAGHFEPESGGAWGVGLLAWCGWDWEFLIKGLYIYARRGEKRAVFEVGNRCKWLGEQG